MRKFWSLAAEASAGDPRRGIVRFSRSALLGDSRKTQKMRLKEIGPVEDGLAAVNPEDH